MQDIREVMTPSPEVVTSDTSIREAAQRMKSQDAGALPVITDGHAAGILTDRDITVRAVAEGKALATTTVGDVMTPDIVSCHDAESIDAVVEKMKEHQVRRVLVQNKDGEIAGIVSLGDLALATEDRKLSADVLRAVSS